MNELYASDFFNGESAPLNGGGPEEQQAESKGLWICRDPHDVSYGCGGEMVYPLDWSEDGPRHWKVLLRCPDCEGRREGRFNQDQIEALDDELDRASTALLGDGRRLTHSNMSEEVEFFSRALKADLIVPSDF